VHQTLLDEDKLFTTKFYNSYYSNMGDVSMTKKQYEEQAKQIAAQAGRKPVGRAIDQMRIDELVDRFLLKDSESNIQLITTAGLDFSGFTQQNSTFINNHQAAVPQSADKKSAQQNTQAAAKGRQPAAKKLSEEKKKPFVQQANVVLAQSTVSTGVLNSKRGQKNSFNSSGRSSNQVPKLDSLKLADSAKTTPRLQQNPHMQTKTIDLGSKQLIQTSPQTKEAIQNYLHNCQIEPHTEPHHQHTHSLAQLGSLLSPNSNTGAYVESPSVKSQQNFPKAATLFQSSQSSQTLIKQQSRQNLKSQCVIPTIQLGSLSSTQQHITNLKKSRLSNGLKPSNQHRKNASPTPAQQALASRNGHIASNSTQKSVKSIGGSVHSKYLSGGSDQYQRILGSLNAQHQLHHNNYETL